MDQLTSRDLIQPQPFCGSVISFVSMLVLKVLKVLQHQEVGGRAVELQACISAGSENQPNCVHVSELIGMAELQ